MAPTIVTRDTWGARPPGQRHAIPIPTPRLWLHHLAADWTGPDGVRRTQNFHMGSRGYHDIAYNFLVDDDGTVYEGRGAGVQGGHTEGDNTGSHAIAAMGDFENRPPTRAMVVSIARLIRHGHESGWWPDRLTGGHRDAPGAQTLCPGRHLQAAIADINALATQPQPTAQEVLAMAEFIIKSEDKGTKAFVDTTGKTVFAFTDASDLAAMKAGEDLSEYEVTNGTWREVILNTLAAPGQAVEDVPKPTWL